MVPLLAGPSRSMQTGAVSGHPDILPPDENSRQPTLVGGSRGAGRVNKMSRSLNSRCFTGRSGNCVSGIHRLDQVPTEIPIPWAM